MSTGTDISALGIKITSSGVVKTTNELTAFAKAARDAGTAASKPVKVNANSAAVVKATSDIKRLDTALTGTGAASAKLAAQTQAETYARRAAATEAQRAANRDWAAAKAKEALANSSRRASVALREQAASAAQANSAASGTSAKRSGFSGNLQNNPANIAAQFQDIGVTAAMGMNPLMIGLQQGTQLSAALAGGLKNLGAAFKQVLSPMSLMTIGLVTAVAALLQMVDWAKLAQSALIGLADILVDIAPYAVAAAGALALIYAPAIIAGVAALVKGFASLAVAMLACIPIPVLIVAGLTAIVAAAVHFRDELTKVLGFDIVQAAQDGVNYIIGFFVGAYKGIVAAWDILPKAIGDIVIQAANATLKAVENMVNGTISLINGLTEKLPFGLGEKLSIGNVSFGQIDNPYAGMGEAAGDIIRSNIAAAQSFNWVGAAIDGVKRIAGGAADWMRGLAASLAGDGVGGKGVSGAATKSAKEMDAWAKLMEDVAKQARDLGQAGDRIGVYGMDLAKLTYEQELLNKAMDAGINPTAKQREEISRLAGELAKISEGNRYKQFMEDIKNSSNDQIAALGQERVELGLTGAALYEYQFTQEAMNKAIRDHIDLQEGDIEKIRERARAVAAAKVEIDAQREVLKRMDEEQRFRLQTIKGAFFSFFDAVREGGNVFKAFADSVINSLNRIIDKMLDQALDGLFGGKSGGILGGLFGGGNSLVKSAASAIAANPSIFAKGGAFGVPHPFAKGGAFTNSVVSSPTLFRFAKGGALGEMGEAGPEAIMPLKRGPNGELGVQSHGGGGRGNATINVQNDYHISGAVTPTDIITMIRQGSVATQTEVKRNLQSWLQEYDRNGAVAA